MLRAFKEIKSHGLLILVGLFYAYLLFHGVSGSQGVFKLAQYDSDISAMQAKIVKEQGQRLTLERRAAQLRSGGLSKDSLGQRSRDLLTVSHAKDIVILLDD